MRKVILVLILCLLVSSVFASDYKLTGNVGCFFNESRVWIVCSSGFEHEINDKIGTYFNASLDILPDLFAQKKFINTANSFNVGAYYCLPKQWPVELHIGGGLSGEVSPNKAMLALGYNVKVDAYGPINEKWSCGLSFLINNYGTWISDKVSKDEKTTHYNVTVCARYAL